MGQFFFITLDNPGPSYQNAARFAQHAQRVEVFLRQLYPEFSGHTVKLLKARKKSKPEWRIALYRGWSSGMLVEMVADAGMSYVAKVTVSWHSRVKQLVQDMFTYLGAFLLLLYLFCGIFFARLIVLIVVAIPFLVAYAIFAKVCEYVVARSAAIVLGNNFDDNRCSDLLARLQEILLPASSPPVQTAATTCAGN